MNLVVDPFTTPRLHGINVFAPTVSVSSNCLGGNSFFSSEYHIHLLPIVFHRAGRVERDWKTAAVPRNQGRRKCPLYRFHNVIWPGRQIMGTT